MMENFKRVIMVDQDLQKQYQFDTVGLEVTVHCAHFSGSNIYAFAAAELNKSMHK